MQLLLDYRNPLLPQANMLLTSQQGFAVLGFLILFMAHLPPENSKRVDEEDVDTETETEALLPSAEQSGGEEEQPTARNE